MILAPEATNQPAATTVVTPSEAATSFCAPSASCFVLIKLLSIGVFVCDDEILLCFFQQTTQIFFLFAYIYITTIFSLSLSLFLYAFDDST